MGRINKVFCDKCDKDLDIDYYKMMIAKPTKNKNDYTIYPTVGRKDLCEECYQKLKEFLERG